MSNPPLASFRFLTEFTPEELTKLVDDGANSPLSSSLQGSAASMGGPGAWQREEEGLMGAQNRPPLFPHSVGRMENLRALEVHTIQHGGMSAPLLHRPAAHVLAITPGY